MSIERCFKTASLLSVSISWMIFRRHSSTPPWIILAKNVCDILIIKYKCYCKQAMKQMVSWILQYSHIFQLKFTVQQSASPASTASPRPIELLQPAQLWEEKRSASYPPGKCRVCFQGGNKTELHLHTPKAGQIWGRKASALEKGWKVDEEELSYLRERRGDLASSQWRIYHCLPQRIPLLSVIAPQISSSSPLVYLALSWFNPDGSSAPAATRSAPASPSLSRMGRKSKECKPHKLR